jgi:hypothetical protein
LGAAGADGAGVAKDMRRLLQMKTRTEYEADHISSSESIKAVDCARRIAEVSRRILASKRP